jgi:Zn-dependent M28 family amino/carboxypeptidase
MDKILKTAFSEKTVSSSYPPGDVNIETLRNIVEFLTRLDPPRNAQHPQSLDVVAAYIEHQFRHNGLSTEMQDFEVDGTTYRNVIGVCGAEKAERIIVGAHYDVCGGQPGADDNASAVAGMVEIARLVNEHKDELPCRVDFVAYSLEEPPFFASEHMGSYVHAQSLHEQGISVRGMLCLEMIGYYTREPNSQKYPVGIMAALYPSVGDFIAVVGNLSSSQLVNNLAAHFRQTSLKVERLIAPALVPGIDFSDNRNFWKFGYPAVMITDTAFYRNPHYHLPTDTIDTLNFEKMADVVNAVVQTLLKC